MPTLHSHTHCQVAPANAQTKTWQRVCLSHRTTDRQSGRKTEGRTANSGLASNCRLTIILPPLRFDENQGWQTERQAQNRYGKGY